MKRRQFTKEIYAALFAALVFVGSQFLRVPLPFGYFNLGDAFVLLSAVVVGGAYAVFASVIGAVLADILSGYLLYAPATAVIKALMVLVMLLCVKPMQKSASAYTVLPLTLGAAAAETLMVLGYFIYDTSVYGIGGAVSSVVGNVFQGVLAVCVFTVALTALKKARS